MNDTLRYLPSVEIRNQQGFEVSRPQSRGFQSSVVQNTRLDGLNNIATTAIPAENLSGVQVLNGLGGSLYGPETPAGVFNYMLKRPTDMPVAHFIESYDGKGVRTEQMDIGGRSGPDGNIGYRLNAVHGEGESYVAGSNVNRSLISADLDFHIGERTVIETDFSHYSNNTIGLPGSIVYDTNKPPGNTSTLLPKAVDPTRVGYGQPGAGTDLITNTGLVKLKHSFNDQWSLEVGGLYQDAERNLFGITNTMTNNLGNYTVTKNFTAVPHFTIGSNLAYLNGHFDLFDMKNDLTIGTNGYTNGQYSYRKSIATTLGSASLANPLVLPTKPIPDNGEQYKSGIVTNQSIIIGDTLHFNEQLAIQGVLSTSFIHAKSWNSAGAVTSSNTLNGVYSPTISLIYKPTSRLTAYATVANSVEQGETAAAGTANVGQILGSYHDHQYEAGIKYTVKDDLLVSLAAFHMTRPLAQTNAVTNIFAVVGTQKNNGLELFAQGNARPDLSVFGGVTYIDAKLQGTGNVLTNDMLVVGVPHYKSDVTLDYYPDYAGGFALTGAVHYESERAATNFNNSFAPSYATLDAGIRYSTVYASHHATARLQVLNLTDTRYYSSVADGNIVGSPGANTAYLGTPRTLMASFELDY